MTQHIIANPSHGWGANGTPVIANPQHKSDAEIAREQSKATWAVLDENVTLLGPWNMYRHFDNGPTIIEEGILAAFTEARQQNEDTARMDWLGQRFLRNIPATTKSVFFSANGDVTLRAAVDAARGAQPAAKQEDAPAAAAAEQRDLEFGKRASNIALQHLGHQKDQSEFLSDKLAALYREFTVPSSTQDAAMKSNNGKVGE